MTDKQSKEDKKAAKAQAKADKKAAKDDKKAGKKEPEEFDLGRRLLSMLYWTIMIATVSVLAWLGLSAFDLITGK